jgi:hypothetical protein
MNAPGTDALPACGQCSGSFEASIAVFVLDALAPTLAQTPLADAERFAALVLDTATRACSGLLPGSDIGALAARVYCIAAAHLAIYVPESFLTEVTVASVPPGCHRPNHAALKALGDLLTTDRERGLALLRHAADDFYDR